MMKVELKVLDGKQQGKAIPLTVRQFLIGREQDCHLRPNSDLVSRHHCVFTLDDFTVRLRDLGSTNGTFVNGERIQGQVVLKPGDHVVVGKLSFEIVVREVAAVGAPVRAASAAGESDSGSGFPAVEPVPGAESMETSLNVSDTIEFPVTPPGDDTTIIPSFPPQEAAAQQQAPQPGYLPGNPYAPPGYGVPPTGIPQGYGMPPGYMPGYPPGYAPPGYPPGYGIPGYMPGYAMPQIMPGAPPGYGVPAAPEQSSPAGSDLPDVVLPDPSTTGAKPVEAPPPPPPAADGQTPESVAAKKPSDAAADIIRMHRLRRSS